MEAHLHAWLSLLIRWTHFIAGVAWIGASFYFNWLENHLQRRQQPEKIAGDLWAIHGGGFYYLKKFSLAPDELPPELHWFKWEAYTTWISGMALLVVIYYWNAQAFMVDTSVATLSSGAAIAVGLASLFMSWIFYDVLCRTGAARREWLLGILILGWFALLAWFLGEFLSGRAAYVHTGAALGTIMVANVFRVIIPAQRDLVRAVTENRAPDPARGVRALQRSRHNNYFTLPVLFVMISSHYPATWAHPHNWLVLLLFALAGICIRHYFNIRHLPGFSPWPLFPAAVLLSFVIWYTAPGSGSKHAARNSTAVETATALAIVRQRCTGCHAQTPELAGFTSAPLGVELDDREKLLQHADRVYQSAVISRSMPLGNLTEMTDTERHTIAAWFKGLQDVTGEEETP